MTLSHALRFSSAALMLSAFAAVSSAQVGSLQGKVSDNGQPVPNALIKIERTDVKGNYQVKTKKKGEWFHAGLPLGMYNVSLEIDGKVWDKVMGIRLGMGDGAPIEFDIGKIKAEEAARAAAASQGQVAEASKEVVASMSPEERKRYEESLKKQQEQLSKNKELNEAFNLGMTAKREGNLPVAIEQLSKAASMDATQHVIYANLADVQAAQADKLRGDERKQMLTDAAGSYRKAIEIKPDTAAYYNNLGLALIKSGEMDEGQTQLAKAAQMDPVNGGKYYFNLGAVMINSGNTDGAIDAFKKATEADPNYGEAYYQMATAMVGKAQTKDDGSIIPAPGTVEAFQKYLQVSPSGPNAESAKMMIESLTGGVETEFRANPKKK